MNWKPQTRAILHALGLHNVIEAKRGAERTPTEEIATILHELRLTILPFISGANVDGEKARQLRESLYAACEPPGAAKRPVYDSLVEAFTNAVQHAYDNDVQGDGLPRMKRWWAAALVDHRNGILHLVVYDQGVGIPATLPGRPWWSVVRAQLPEFSDEAVIAGALSYGRSGTGQSGRGNGLWRMCELTEAFEAAEVQFTSGKGRVIYAKGGVEERASLPARFCGTMIRWRAKIARLEQV